MIQERKTLLKSISNRRALLTGTARGSAALLIGSTLAQTACTESIPLQVTQLSDNMSVISGAGSNVLVSKAANGELLVVDGGLAENSSALLTTIKESTNSNNITTLMNTHWHPEQTGLNQVLGEAGCRIFAHENTRLWLDIEVERPWEETRFEPLPVIAHPNDTFYHYGELSHGDLRVEYGYLLQAHTDGDMYVYFPEENVIHAGGVVANDIWPLMDWWTGGWIGGLVDGLETLLTVANDDTLIVPANGPVMSKAELSAMHHMYVSIFQEIRSLFMAARGPQETLDARPTAEFDAQWGNSDQFVLLSHQSLLAHLAPDA